MCAPVGSSAAVPDGGAIVCRGGPAWLPAGADEAHTESVWTGAVAARPGDERRGMNAGGCIAGGCIAGGCIAGDISRGVASLGGASPGVETPGWNHGKPTEAGSHGSGYRARFSGLPVPPAGGFIPSRRRRGRLARPCAASIPPHESRRGRVCFTPAPVPATHRVRAIAQAQRSSAYAAMRAATTSAPASRRARAGSRRRYGPATRTRSPSRKYFTARPARAPATNGSSGTP